MAASPTWRREIVNDAAKRLDKAKMIRYDENNGIMSSIDMGRTASHFYIKYDTVEIFNDLLKNFMNEGEILAMISQAQEFEQLKVRDDEMTELDEATHEYCELPVKGGAENVHGTELAMLLLKREANFEKVHDSISFIQVC